MLINQPFVWPAAGIVRMRDRKGGNSRSGNAGIRFASGWGTEEGEEKEETNGEKRKRRGTVGERLEQKAEPANERERNQR